MAAAILAFPSATDAQRLARERRVGNLVCLMEDLISGKRRPVDDREARLAILLERLERRAAELQAERATREQAVQP